MDGFRSWVGRKTGNPTAWWHARLAVLTVVFVGAMMAPALVSAPLVGLAAGPAAGTGAGPGYCSSVGGSAAGASFLNIYACNGYDSANAPVYNFQCVELAERFFHAMMGFWVYGANTGAEFVQAGSHEPANNHSGPNVRNLPVGTPGPNSVPSLGDIISYAALPGHPDGHVAIVTAVNLSAGSGSITVMEENWAGNGTDTGDNAGSHAINVNRGQWSEWLWNSNSDFSWLKLGIAPPPPPIGGAFSRYLLNTGTPDHFSSTGQPGVGYNFEKFFGFLSATQWGGTHPLYACQIGYDEFTSRSSNCESQTVIGLLGYANDSSPSASAIAERPLYRCATANWEHFDTNDPACENQPHNDGLLGYLDVAASLNRFVNAATSAHFSTTGQPPAGYGWEKQLGWLSPPLAGTHALYSCMIGQDEFTSTQSNCEGQVALGILGYAYDSTNPQIATQPLYRCATASWTHFDTNASNCEGQPHNEGVHGYLAPGPQQGWS